MGCPEVFSKSEMFDHFSDGLTSADFDSKSEMYFAMYAYETYGNATRDNTFAELVDLGRELEENGGPEGM